MIIIINKIGDPPVSLEDTDSYFEGFDRSKLQKIGKDKTGNLHYDELSALLKISAEDRKNDPVIG